MTETQQRFLKAIAERVPSERVVELRLFPAIRQGHVESAVAVVAVEVLPGETEREIPLAVTPDGDASGDRSRDALADSGAPATLNAQRPVLKYSVLTARYRLTIKGPDRGKWEFEMVHDADAPLDAVERVVRGVVRRVGEDSEPDYLSTAEFARALVEPWWTGSA